MMKSNKNTNTKTYTRQIILKNGGHLVNSQPITLKTIQKSSSPPELSILTHTLTMQLGSIQLLWMHTRITYQCLITWKFVYQISYIKKELI